MMDDPKNQGEGNQTAARQYDEATTAFAKSGRVEAAAEEAKRSLDTPEGRANDEAARKAAARAKEHDPEESRDYRKAD
jgi:hypothetical protein